MPDEPVRPDAASPHRAAAPASAPLLVLAHDDAWRARFQVSSLAASAVAAGQEVAVAFFFDALAAWVTGRWDFHEPAPPVTLDRLEALDLPPLSSLLAAGRDSGRLRLYACSASVRILGLDSSRVAERVDAIVGWPTFHRLIRQAERVVTL
ncbi:MAG TPA: DsrE family protein [Thermoanaerobaculia bacterium]